MATVEIHEFSTGINAERLPDGGWRSLGFRVSEYMNLTLSDIPRAVKRAIANKRFEVFKDRHSQEPSFVGWVLPSTENRDHDWSVVAVVTPGQDEGGRSTSFYRYFLCEGRDSLWKILAWMEDYQQQSGGKWPVFDPLASKQVGESHQWNVNAKPKLKLPDNWQSFLNENQTPVVIKRGDASNLKMINAMAEVKANSEQVSWAYNVEVMERPEQFIIIQAANEESYQRLMQRRQGQANNTRLMPLSVDEAAIKTAINGLIGGSQVRDEWIQSILGTLEGNQLTVEQWEAVFDDQGAGMAIKRGSADPRMSRILTLRAFVLPETLPEFLGWLWKIEGKKKQENLQNKASQEFQSKLLNKLNQRPQNFTDGIKKALKALLEKKISVESLIWLFNAGGSIWRPYRRPLVEDVRTDLIAIRDLLSSNGNTPDPKELRCGEEIWSDLCSYWQNSNYRYGNYYKPFAELFAGLGKLENSFDLSAYFYQVSDEQVPKSIFKQGVSNGNGDEGEVYGLQVQRRIELPEKAGRFVVKYAKIIFIVSLLLSTHGTIYLWGKNNGFKEGFEKGKNVAMQRSRNDIITEEQKEIAINNFAKTAETIENIVSELAKLKVKGTENQPLRKDIIGEVQNALVLNKDESKEIDYKKATSTGWLGLGIDLDGGIARAKNKFVEAIYNYQKIKPNLLADGYIEHGNNTANLLTCDVADSLKLELKPRPSICQQLDRIGEDSAKKIIRMTDVEMKEAKKNFSRITKTALEKMVEELMEDPDLKRAGVNLENDIIVKGIKETLPIQGELNYAGAVKKKDDKQIEILVQAIFSYQSEHMLAADGIMSLNGETYPKLKAQVRNRLLNSAGD